jgi:Ca-activated chloride channel family protein
MPARLLTLMLFVLLAAVQRGSAAQQRVKIDVDLVLVNAGVTDSDGRIVTGLDKDRFQIWEDRVEQQIRYFSTEYLPVSVGIVFDISSSMRDKLSVSREAVLSFLKAGTPEDEYALIEFNSRAQVTQNFTSDVAEFQNPLALSSPQGSTALYDAVYMGIDKVRKGHNPRKALLLVTDGEDNHSRYTFSDVQELAREADVQLFAIGISGFTIPTATKGRKSGRAVLQELVDLTGGQVFFTTSALNLDEICTRISENLRNEYLIGYSSTNGNKDGKWRNLRLKVASVARANPGARISVHARKGYYAPVN